MPTYEYACKGCGEHLEVVQSFRDEPLSTCPNCEGPLRKVFGSIGIAFRGPGFYRTDSRETRHRKDAATVEKKEPAKAGSESGSGSSGSGSSGTGSADKGASTSTVKTDSPAPKAAASS